jgi:uncharacterized membrane protein
MALAVFSACGDDGDGDPIIVPSSIVLTLGSPTVTLTQGAAATVNLSVARTGEVGDVVISVSGLPAGVTVSPLTLTSGVTTGTLTLTAAANAAVGGAATTVTAAATGVSSVTQPLSVVVQQAPTGGFTLTAGTSVTLQQGGSVSFQVAVARTAPFTSAVALTSVNTPSGFTVSFNPQSVTGTTSTVTIAAATSVPVGTHQITIQGSGGGNVASQSVTISATVQQATTGAFTLDPGLTSITLPQAGSVTLQLAVARTPPFTGPVALTSVNTPAGFTVSFNPQSVTGNTSTVTISAASTVPTGTYQITMQGSAGGSIPNQSVTISATVTPAPAFTLSLSAASLTLAAGSSGTVTVNVNRSAGFANVVTLAASGGPPGMSANFSPPGVSANSAALIIGIPSAAAPGSYTVTITGSAAGFPNQTATLALTVTPAASFVVSVSPVQMDVQQGSTTSVTVNISRLNLFSGPVALTASGVPAGVTASFNPQSTTGDQSTLTFTASAGAVPNTYQVTITGTGGTPTAQSSANLTLIVLGSAASLEGRVVSITP